MRNQFSKFYFIKIGYLHKNLQKYIPTVLTIPVVKSSGRRETRTRKEAACGRYGSVPSRRFAAPFERLHRSRRTNGNFLNDRCARVCQRCARTSANIVTRELPALRRFHPLTQQHVRRRIIARTCYTGGVLEKPSGGTVRSSAVNFVHGACIT